MAQQKAIKASVTYHEALALAQKVFPEKDWTRTLEPSYYRLTGVVFRVSSPKGPSRRLNGQLIRVLVDPRTRRAWTSDDWNLSSEPVDSDLVQEEPLDDVERQQLVKIAQEAAYVQFLKHYRLAASFEFLLEHVQEAVWKPNWYAETRSHRLLIDGITGRYATATKPTAGVSPTSVP